MADGVSQSETSNHGTVAVDVYGHPAPAHRGSLSPRGLFGKISVELRNAIYEETFTGSEMTLLSTPRGDPRPPSMATDTPLSSLLATIISS